MQTYLGNSNRADSCNDISKLLADEMSHLCTGVLAIRGLEFRGFAIRGFLKPSKCPHFAITPSFLELKMLKNGYFFK